MSDLSDYVDEYPSPHGRYLARTFAEEVRASHWVYTPSVHDTETGEVLVRIVGGWSAESVEWKADDTVVMTLRCYPHGHAVYTFVVDCSAREFTLARGPATGDAPRPRPLSDLAAALQSAKRRLG